MPRFSRLHASDFSGIFRSKSEYTMVNFLPDLSILLELQGDRNIVRILTQPLTHPYMHPAGWDFLLWKKGSKCFLCVGLRHGIANYMLARKCAQVMGSWEILSWILNGGRCNLSCNMSCRQFQRKLRFLMISTYPALHGSIQTTNPHVLYINKRATALKTCGNKDWHTFPLFWF